MSSYCPVHYLHGFLKTRCFEIDIPASQFYNLPFFVLVKSSTLEAEAWWFTNAKIDIKIRIYGFVHECEKIKEL